MKLVFLIDDNLYSANTKIAMTLAKKMSENAEVYGIGFPIEGSAGIDPKECFSDYLRIRSYKAEYLSKFKEANHWNELGGRKKLFCYFTHWKAFVWNLQSYHLRKFWIDKENRERIRDFCLEKKADFLIAVTEPFFLLEAVDAIEGDWKKALIQVDPYATNHARSEKGIPKRMKQEMELYRRLHRIFTTDLIFRDMQAYHSEEVLRKICCIEFPEIRMDRKEDNRRTENRKRDGSISFAFLGAFYRDIRNPEFLIRVFRKLPQNYVLHVAGPHQELLSPYREELGSRLVLHGIVDREEAGKMREEADILVNLGNTVENQVPSKLFEYIETGKPILNLCLIENCPSLKYMAKYPNALSLSSRQYQEPDTHKVIQFVSTHLGKRIGAEEIRLHFHENTDEYVASLILSDLNKDNPKKEGYE